jgi:cysteine desulfurase
VALNGGAANRVPGNLNIAFPAGVTAQALMEASAAELCVSTGSACSSAEVEPSYVLRAIGVPDAVARSSLRIGIGRFTSPADVDLAAAALGRAWRQARSVTQDAAE